MMIFSNKPVNNVNRDDLDNESANKETIEETWLDLKGLAEYLHVSRSTLYNMISDGRLPMHRVGKQLRIHRNTVDELVLSGKLAL